MKWIKKGFDGFSRGTLGNGGQNLYVSANGVLQRIFQYDVNADGYPDLLFANSQSMGERPPVYLYKDPLHSAEFVALITNGPYDAVMCDLNGDGCDDLVIACQNDGAHCDIAAVLYFGSPDGFSAKFKMEIPVPDATGVVAGDFNGDGRPDLVFISEHALRVFYQSELGILPFAYTILPIDAASIAAADLDHDGYCDLYAKMANGSTVVYWGGPNGLDPTRQTVFFGNNEKAAASSTSTPGRKAIDRTWHASVLTIGGKQHLFRADLDQIYFYTVEADRTIKLAFSLPCKNAVAAAAGDLDQDGFDDLAVAVCHKVDRSEDSLVFWNLSGSFSSGRVSSVPSISATNVSIAPFADDGACQLVVCQGGTNVMRTTQSFIYGFDKKRHGKVLKTMESGDAMRIVSGYPDGGRTRQLVVINHETGRVRGDENVAIYLGGKDGYKPNRKMEFPGFSAVDGLMFDCNDDGLVDVLISNCSENAPYMDPGSFLYLNGPGGLSPDRRTIIPTVRGHGAIVGDFRKRGYLDIASGGFHNRMISIFHGGPNGYDVDHPTQIVLGPDPDHYLPPRLGSKIDIDAEAPEPDTPEEAALYKEFGETRWLFAADFNGDGWLDLFISQIVGPYCYILWGGPDGFSADRMLRLATDGVASANAADLDGDGYLDLVLGGHQSIGKSKEGKYDSYITIYWGGPKGYQENRKTQLPASCANAVTIGDFNGDGILDIYASAYHTSRSRDILSYVYYGEKGGIYSIRNRQVLFNHSGSGCVAGDFNGDGYADLAVACHKGDGNHCSESFVFWGGPDGLSEARKIELPTTGPHGMSIVDPGNLMDRSDNEYYYSEIYPVPINTLLKSASWDVVTPSYCHVNMRIRHGNTEDQLKQAVWSDEPIQNRQDLSALGISQGYIQYRLTLTAPCSCGTPRITAITIDFEEN